jgi:hypothetical protein
VKLSKSDLKVANAAATEENRPSLYHVLLRDGKLVAADGFILVVKKANLDPKERLAKAGEVLLPTKMMDALKPSGRETAEVILAGDGKLNAYVVGLNRLAKEPIFVFTQPRTEANFPAYETKAIPRNEKEAKVALNIVLLRKLLSALPQKGTLRIGVGKPTDPVEFAIMGEDEEIVRAFQMPMFIDWDEFEGWLKDQPDYEEKTVEQTSDLRD